MIEVSCGKCGSILRVDAASVPPGGKVVKCSSCGRLVRVSPSARRAGAAPSESEPADAPQGGKQAGLALGPSGSKSVAARAAKPVAPIELGRFADAAASDDDLSLEPMDISLGESGTSTAQAPDALSGEPALDISLGSSGGMDEPEADMLSGAPDLATPLGPAGVSEDAPGRSTPVLKSKAGFETENILDLPDPTSESPEVQVSDLPAPKAKSRPDIPAPRGKPTPEASDLPAPKARSKPSVIDLPAPISGSKPDIRVPDALAAKITSAPNTPAAKGASRPATPVADLPAPKSRSKSDVFDLPAPISASKPDIHVPDLPAPKSVSRPEISPPRSASKPDVPPPKDASRPDVPPPRSASRPATPVSDLPAPKGRSRSDVFDLPAPISGSKPDIDISQFLTPASANALETADLPAPSSRSKQDVADLPAPSTRSKQDIADLPAPKAGPGKSAKSPSRTIGAGADDLPAPRASAKSEPLPADAPNALDLGSASFFDDIPAPVEAPNALDLPAGGTSWQLDDADALDLSSLPDLGAAEPASGHDAWAAPAPASTPGAGQGDGLSLELDDLDLGVPAESQPASAVTPAKGPASPSFDLAATPGGAKSSQSVPALGFLDIGVPDSPSDTDSQPMSLDLGVPTGAPAAGSESLSLGSLDLGLPDSGDSTQPGAMSLDFGLPDSGDSAQAGATPLDFGLPASGDDLGLPSVDFGLPSTDAPGPAPSAKTRGPAKSTPGKGKSSAGTASFGEVELSGEPSDEALAPAVVKGPKQDKKPAATTKAAAVARLSRTSEVDEPLALDEAVMREAKASKKGQTVAAADVAVPKDERTKKRNARIIAAAVIIGVLGLGGGGFYGYQYWTEQKSRKAAVAQGIESARMNMNSDLSGHWTRAGKAAAQSLEHDAYHPKALGLAAQGYYAAFLDEGTTQAAAGLREAGQYIKRINEKSLDDVEVSKAQALKSIVELRPEAAIDLLNGVLEKTGGSDPDALLYLGWAQASAGLHQPAAKTFAAAVDASPKRKVPALYGLGQAQIELGQVAEARETFKKVLESEPEHVGALIGAARVAEVSDPKEREQRYLDILGRPGLDKLDRRAVSRAWELAGHEALRGGRLDEAQTRFTKALEMNDGNLEARLGLARVALGQNRLKDVREPLEAVLKANPEHAGAMLTAAELGLGENKIDEAKTHIDKLLQREGAMPSKRERAQIHFIHGKILETQAGADTERLNEASKAYEKARELAGEDDVRPTVALAQLLSRVGRKDEARDMLSPLRTKAEADTALAITLGQVYAKSDAPMEAEQWFRKALDMRPEDAETRFQLGLSLRAQGREDEALTAIAEAFAADKSRTDIGAELAITYEAKSRDSDARTIYDELLKASSPSMTLLERAGRFFVRTGEPKRASELGELILKEQPESAFGLYLRGEGQYQDKKYEDALRSFRDAARIEPTAQYFEAKGRASEQLNYHDEALNAYTQAAELDKTYLVPLIGEARVRIIRRDFDRALAGLDKASKLNPRSADVYHLIGVCYQEQGELNQAAGSFERALRLDRRRAETHYRLGQIYFDLDKQAKAASEFTEATRLAEPTAPWLAKAYLNLGYAQRSRGNRRETVAAWEEYLALNPENSAEVAEVKRLLIGLKGQ